MIPHHSMAVHISKKLLPKKSETDDRTNRLIESIIKTQEAEIEVFKKRLTSRRPCYYSVVIVTFFNQRLCEFFASPLCVHWVWTDRRTSIVIHLV